MTGAKKDMVKRENQGRTPQMLLDSLRLAPVVASVKAIIPTPRSNGLSAHSPKTSNAMTTARNRPGRWINQVFMLVDNLQRTQVRNLLLLEANIQHPNLLKTTEGLG